MERHKGWGGGGRPWRAPSAFIHSPCPPAPGTPPVQFVYMMHACIHIS